jgi:hypothetical protein
MLALLWGLLSFYIRGMVDNLEVTWLAMAGVVTSLFLTSQDVSMDGFKINLIIDGSSNSQKTTTRCPSSLGGVRSATPSEDCYHSRSICGYRQNHGAQPTSE